MENKPLISVITVCYNAEETIRETIESVLSQTYDNIEYIIVDGASKDGTVAIINEYADRIAKFISEPDKGLYYAMNKGIEMASGEWITFRNSGDLFLHPKALEKFFAAPVADDVSVVHGNCVYTNEWGYCEQTPGGLVHSHKVGMPVLHPAAFVRASVHKQRHFDTTYRSSADYNFMYQCCEEGLKMEYRPIAIVTFPVGGFAMQNLMKTYREDCRIKNLDATLSGKVKKVVGGAVLSLKCRILALARKNRCLADMRKKSLLKQGWTPLPIDLSRYV